MHSKPEGLTDVQEAFFVGLTDQRVANMWAVADDWADLKPEAKELLHNAEPETLKWLERASKEDIEQLKYSIKFMNASKVLGRAAWIVGAILFGLIMGGFALWEKIEAYFRHKS